MNKKTKVFCIIALLIVSGLMAGCVERAPEGEFERSPYPILLDVAVDENNVIVGETANVTVKLLDEDGNVTTAREDIRVNLSATYGMMASSVIIARGENSTKTQYSCKEINESVCDVIFAKSYGMIGDSTSVAVFFPTPVELDIAVDDYNLMVGDTATVSVRLLDQRGMPVVAQEDIIVNLSATYGWVAHSVLIARGQNATETLYSCEDINESVISDIFAESEGINGDSVSVAVETVTVETVDLMISIRPFTVDELTEVLRRDSQVPLVHIGNKTMIDIGNKRPEDLARGAVASGYGCLRIKNKYLSRPLSYTFWNGMEMKSGKLAPNQTVGMFVNGRAIRGTMENLGDSTISVWVSKGTCKDTSNCDLFESGAVLRPNKVTSIGSYEIPMHSVSWFGH